MRIAVMGTGGVGGYFGARLAAAGHEVAFVARGRQLDALLARGLRVQSPLGDVHLPDVEVTDEPAEIGPVDLVLFTVKLWATREAAEDIKPLLDRETAVVSFQNGVVKDDILRGSLGGEHVIGGVTYIAATIAEPGLIRHSGTLQKLVFGEYDGSLSPRVRRFRDACVESGIDVEVSDRIEQAIWEKFVFLVGLSGTTSLARSPIGPIRSHPRSRAFLHDVMQEVVQVALAQGVPLPADYADDRLAFTDQVPATMTSSMHRDLEQGNRLEVAWLSGDVVERGARLGVATPCNRAIFDILSIHSDGRSPDQKSVLASDGMAVRMRRRIVMTISSPGAVDVADGEGPSLLAIARSLEPLIREHAQALEDRRVPPSLVDALYDSGVFQAMLPREVGGLEVEPVEWLRMIEELARINSSVGWLAFINSGVGLTFLDPERFAKFRARGGGRLILAMSLGRLGGKAVKVEGGYRVTGRWPFASGSPFATWLGGMSIVCDEAGAPAVDASGQPQRLLAIWPADQAQLIDTWDGLGLRGTGSGDFAVSDLFVPQEQVNPGFYGAPVYDRALFRMKEIPEVGHGAHALGVASGALRSFAEAVNARPLPESPRQMAMGHQQAHQIAYARADALIRAARALLHETVRAAYENAKVSSELDLELRVRLREANVFAVRTAKEAVGLIFDMAGSSAVYRGRAIEQAFRDINTAANHTNYMETAYTAIGAYFLTRDRADGPEIVGRPFL